MIDRLWKCLKYTNDNILPGPGAYYEHSEMRKGGQLPGSLKMDWVKHKESLSSMFYSPKSNNPNISDSLWHLKYMLLLERLSTC